LVPADLHVGDIVLARPVLLIVGVEPPDQANFGYGQERLRPMAILYDKAKEVAGDGGE